MLRGKTIHPKKNSENSRKFKTRHQTQKLRPAKQMEKHDMTQATNSLTTTTTTTISQPYTRGLFQPSPPKYSNKYVRYTHHVPRPRSQNPALHRRHLHAAAQGSAQESQHYARSLRPTPALGCGTVQEFPASCGGYR